MPESPPDYYECIPYETHPPLCPCLYHQIDGDTLLKEAEEADRAEAAARAEAADFIDWAYLKIHGPKQLTRDAILELFSTRDEWLSAHAIWSQVERKRAAWAFRMARDAMTATIRYRVEVEYRRESVKFLTPLSERLDYTSNWRDWAEYVCKMEALLRQDGPMRQYENKLWALVALMMETKELYGEFWDLDGASGFFWLDPACEDNLKKLRTNLARMKTLQSEIQNGKASTIDLCNIDRCPPPIWLGGIVAPELNERAPEDDPLWTL